MYQNALFPAEMLMDVSQNLNDYKTKLTNIDWTEVATVVIAGIVIVLGVLLVLIGVFGGFGKLVSQLEATAKKRKLKKEAKKAAKASEATAVAFIEGADGPAEVKPGKKTAPVAEQGISGEVIAAITAAITASEGSDKFVIRSVKRKEAGSRNPWARAAVADNTRSF